MEHAAGEPAVTRGEAAERWIEVGVAGHPADPVPGGTRHVARVPREVCLIEQLLDGFRIRRLIRPDRDTVGPDGVRIGAIERLPHPQYLRFELKAVLVDEREQPLVCPRYEDANRVEPSRASPRDDELRQPFSA